MKTMNEKERLNKINQKAKQLLEDLGNIDHDIPEITWSKETVEEIIELSGIDKEEEEGEPESWKEELVKPMMGYLLKGEKSEREKEKNKIKRILEKFRITLKNEGEENNDQ